MPDPRWDGYWHVSSPRHTVTRLWVSAPTSAEPSRAQRQKELEAELRLPVSGPCRWSRAAARTFPVVTSICPGGRSCPSALTAPAMVPILGLAPGHKIRSDPLPACKKQSICGRGGEKTHNDKQWETSPQESVPCGVCVCRGTCHRRHHVLGSGRCSVPGRVLAPSSS